MDRRALLRGMGGAGLLAALAGCAPSYPSPRLRIATGEPKGEYNPLGKALAKAWTDVLRLDTAPEVLVTAGSPANIQQLTSGVELAISQLDVASEAYQRNSPPGAVDMRALTRIYDDVVHVVVRQDSPIRSLAQLGGHAVSVGSPTSGTLFVARRLLPVVGLSVETSLAPAQPFGLDRSLSELRAGRIEAFLWVGALPTPGILTLAGDVDIRLVDLADIAKQVQKIYPVYAPRLIAAGTYKGVDESLTTLSVRNVLLARRDMLDPLAYDLTKALFLRQSQITEAAPSALTIDTRRGIGTEPVPLHPGAAQWFRESRESG